MTILRINWYKKSGKWYAGEDIAVGDEYDPMKYSVKAFVENNQTSLHKEWTNSDWYVSVTCLDQKDDDSRFFERLFIYGE